MAAKWLSRLCFCIALSAVLVGVFNLLWFMHYSFMAASFPYGLNYVEGLLWSQSSELAHGHSIYTPFDQAPYTVGNYPPLYPLLCSLAEPLGFSTLAFGRAVSAIAIVVCALLVALSVYDASADRSDPHEACEGAPLPWPRILCAALAGLCFLQVPYVYAWGPLMRVDMLAWAFSLGGLYLLLRAQGRTRVEYAAIALFVLAAYTKHSVVACAVAGLVAATLRDRSRGLRLGAAYAGAGLAVFLLLSLLTGGWFWKHVIQANAMPYAWPQAARFLALMLSLNALWAVLALAGMIWGLARPRAEAAYPGYRIALPVFFVLAFLVGLSSGKIGADRNYLVEFSMAACIGAGAFLARLWEKAPSTFRLAGAAATLLGCTAQVSWTYLNLLPSDPGKFLDRNAVQKMERIQALVRSTPGDVYSEDTTLLMHAGRRVEFQGFDMVMLAKMGLWDQAPMLQKFERQAYALIVLQVNPEGPAEDVRLTPEMVDAIRTRYRCVYTDGYYCFFPKPAGDPAK